MIDLSTGPTEFRSTSVRAFFENIINKDDDISSNNDNINNRESIKIYDTQPDTIQQEIEDYQKDTSSPLSNLTTYMYENILEG